MFFKGRNIFEVIFASLFVLEVNALVLKPIVTVPNHPSNPSVKRDDRPPGIQLVPIRDAGEMTGRFTKRERPGKSCYDPASENEFLWGAYGKYIPKPNTRHGVFPPSRNSNMLNKRQRAITSTWQISHSERLGMKSLSCQLKTLQRSSRISGVASLEKG